MTSPVGRTGGRGGQLAVLVIAVIAAPLFIWGVIRIAGGDDAPGPGDSAGRPGVSHVHGLGINPADGSLIVATHSGSFRLDTDGGEAARIGETFQDTMGFTVVGPNHFLGSGHPDLQSARAGRPGRLGLIESTDAGATWTILSLGGEVDFHSLAFAHGRVYGWDSGSGSFMVSDDRTDWETRSIVDLFGFAVDPDDGDHIVVAGPGGLIDSHDGGRTWEASDAVRLATISWDDRAGLWGVDPRGDVWHRDGHEWTRSGALPGEPDALLATADALYTAAHDDDGVAGIYKSTDEGRTWNVLYRDTNQ